MNLAGKAFLDVGTGSGAPGILAARQGARVTAVDVNPDAVALARSNAALNHVSDRFEAMESDLFSAIPADRRFDRIAFNPPFYPRTPSNDEERAWLAGEDYATLRAFFRDAGRFLAPSGQIVLILSSDTDLDLLAGIAEQNGLILVREVVVPHLFEVFVIREYSPHPASLRSPSPLP